MLVRLFCDRKSYSSLWPMSVLADAFWGKLLLAAERKVHQAPSVAYSDN